MSALSSKADIALFVIGAGKQSRRNAGLSAGAGPLTAAKHDIIPAQHYSGGCNPGKRPDTRRMVFASRTDRSDIAHDRYSCIAAV